MADSFDVEFYKLRSGNVEVLCSGHEEAVNKLINDFKGKMVEVTFPCSITGKLIVEFYEVTKKGGLKKQQINDNNVNGLNLAC